MPRSAMSRRSVSPNVIASPRFAPVRPLSVCCLRRQAAGSIFNTNAGCGLVVGGRCLATQSGPGRWANTATRGLTGSEVRL